MQIGINGWVETGPRSGELVEGTEEDAIRIAGELFLAGVNVMMYRGNSSDSGESTIVIFTDTRRFSQR